MFFSKARISREAAFDTRLAKMQAEIDMLAEQIAHTDSSVVSVECDLAETRNRLAIDQVKSLGLDYIIIGTTDPLSLITTGISAQKQQAYEDGYTPYNYLKGMQIWTKAPAEAAK